MTSAMMKIGFAEHAAVLIHPDFYGVIED